ncbi:MAG: hypothetical protein LBF89_01740 [Bacteroidales bacterium]|jgi:hypothetical protein|nr:hypothetical protein [Bacteroidales bacterium]
MKRIFIPVAIGSALIFGVLTFFQKGIVVDINMPEVIQAGSEITVSVFINKSKLTGFARLQQDLPYGFTAKPVNSANADFNFENQRVRLIWLNLPEEEQFTATYTIVADERLKGTVDLGGVFSYVEDNERKSFDIQSQRLTIQPSSKLDASQMIDVKDFASMVKPKPQTAQSEKIAGIRRQPQWYQANNAFLVTLLINKNKVDKLAKLEETIPAGYKAEIIDGKNAIFSFENQTAKFVWNVLPSEPYFIIKYKVTPDGGTQVDPANLPITGVFSYLDGDKTMAANVMEQNENLDELTPTLVNDLIAKTVTASDVSTQTVTPTEQTVVASPEAVSVAPAAATEDPPAPALKKTPTISGTATSSGKKQTIIPETGIHFRVQVAAGRREVNTPQVFKKYQLGYNVVREQHDGWYKYSVGTFFEYKTARDYRVYLRTETPLDGAFVTAYNDGQRITVQEALLSLNQKWIK